MNDLLWAKAAVIRYFASTKTRLITREQFQQALRILKENNIKIYLTALDDPMLMIYAPDKPMDPSLKSIFITKDEYLAAVNKENILKIDF